MTQPQPGDPAPIIGAPTDVSPVSAGAKPPHERTAADEMGGVDWQRIAASVDFRALLREKIAFILPATIFFVAYYFALPLLVGYAPEFMERKVFGEVNVAYLFALSQFFMAWIIAALYVRAAGRFDKLAAAILARLGR